MIAALLTKGAYLMQRRIGHIVIELLRAQIQEYCLIGKRERLSVSTGFDVRLR